MEIKSHSSHGHHGMFKAKCTVFYNQSVSSFRGRFGDVEDNNNSEFGRKTLQKKGGRRADSPEYDSDESTASHWSRSTSPADRILYNPRFTTAKLQEQNELLREFSKSTPEVFSPAGFYSAKNRHNHNFNSSKTRINNNPRSYYHHQNSNDVIMRRAHGLVERFRSRADFMKINAQPPGIMDQLSQAIWDVFSLKAQSIQTYDCKINLWRNIFLYTRKCLNSYGLFIVGSTMSGFGVESSDIDMCLLTRPCLGDARIDALQHLTNVRDLLLQFGVTNEPELILAKVPILKFKDNQTGFEIDLNCNNAVGIKNTHLLHCYARLDWRVRPLVVLIKLWAQANHINDAKSMTISSYSWALMVIHYLQCGVSPAVLPCLHAQLPDKFDSSLEAPYPMDVQEDISLFLDFKSENTNSLAELLLGFLHYYTCFDFAHFAISVRAGAKIPIQECRFAKAPKNDPHQWKFVCIEEPFDFTNTARSVFDNEMFKRIQTIIINSYYELLKSNCLNNILPVQLYLEKSSSKG